VLVSPLREKTPCSRRTGKMKIAKREARVGKRVRLRNPSSIAPISILDDRMLILSIFSGHVI